MKTAELMLLLAVTLLSFSQTLGCKYNIRQRKYSCDNGGHCLMDRFSTRYCECRRGFAGKACEKKCYEKNSNIRDCCNDLTTTCAYAHSNDECGYKKCLEAVLQDRLSCPEMSRFRPDILRSLNNVGRQCNLKGEGVVQQRNASSRPHSAKHTTQPAAARVKPAA